MEEELSLKLDLLVVVSNAFLFSNIVPHTKQDVDDDNDGAKGSAHLVSHVFVAVLHYFHLPFAVVVLLFQNVI